MKRKYLPVDYVNIKKDIPFSIDPFNEVDTTGFILFLLMDIDRIGIPKVGEDGYITYADAVKNQHELHGDKKYGLLLPTSINQLIDACAESKRFKDVKFYNLVNKVDDITQSSFVMCDISDEVTLVIFGGTDDSVIGWVEDFDLLLSHDVKCLKNARNYVNNFCREPNRKYILMGHSKGGMTTCYTFFTIDQEIRDNVLVAYDMDGPGFDQDFLMEHMDCPEIDKLKLICPREAFVGRLFFQAVPAIVCKSVDKGINQHNPSGWVVDGNQFSRAKGYGKSGTVQAVMAYEFMNDLSEEEKHLAINAITKVVMSSDAKTLSKLIFKPFKLIGAFFKLSKPEKRIILKVPFKLLKNKFQARKKVDHRQKAYKDYMKKNK